MGAQPHHATPQGQPMGVQPACLGVGWPATLATCDAELSEREALSAQQTLLRPPPAGPLLWPAAPLPCPCHAPT